MIITGNSRALWAREHIQAWSNLVRWRCRSRWLLELYRLPSMAVQWLASQRQVKWMLGEYFFFLFNEEWQNIPKKCSELCKMFYKIGSGEWPMGPRHSMQAWRFLELRRQVRFQYDLILLAQVWDVIPKLRPRTFGKSQGLARFDLLCASRVIPL